jgi:outer membrane biosynthesis protein TonB
MAGIRDDRRQFMMPESVPTRRSTGVLVMLLIAVTAAIALIWNMSRRSHHRGDVAPVLSTEPAATPVEPEPDPAPAAVPTAAAAAAPTEREPTNGEKRTVAKVIRDGRPGLTACYQRALVRDATLVHGRLNVRVSIAPSGRVDNVKMTGPAAFRPLEPCLERAVSKWDFPPAAAAYVAEFPLVLQGNE